MSKKTFGDVLNVAIETSKKYKSDVSFEYSGGINCISLYMYQNGYDNGGDRLGYQNQLLWISSLDKRSEEEVATDMIKWIESNRIKNEVDVDEVAKRMLREPTNTRRDDLSNF